MDQGDNVKLLMQFRGREMANKDAGLEKFHTIVNGLKEYGASTQSEPKMMGNRIITIISSDRKVPVKKKA